MVILKESKIDIFYTKSTYTDEITIKILVIFLQITINGTDYYYCYVRYSYVPLVLHVEISEIFIAKCVYIFIFYVIYLKLVNLKYDTIRKTRRLIFNSYSSKYL